MDLFSVIGDIFGILSDVIEGVISFAFTINETIIGAIGSPIGNIIGFFGSGIGVMLIFITFSIVGAIGGAIGGAVVGALRGKIALGIHSGIFGKRNKYLTLYEKGGGCASGPKFGCGSLIIFGIILGIAKIVAPVIGVYIGVRIVDPSAIITASIIIGGMIGGIFSAIAEIDKAEAEAKRKAEAERIAEIARIARAEVARIAQAKVIPEAKTREKRATPPLHAFNISMYNYEYLPQLETPEGYVYFVQDVEVSKHYKIGRTTAPQTHLKRLSIDLPIKVKVIAILQTNNAPALEQELHHRYAAQRTQDGWFDLTDRQIQEIRSI